MSAAPAGRILIVDDVQEIRSACKTVLERAGYEVITKESLEEGRRFLAQEAIDVLLLDNQLPDGSGLDFLGELARSTCDFEIVLMTAYGNFEMAVTAIKSGAYDFLTKPFKDLSLISHVVSKALERRRLIRRAHNLEQQMGETIEGIIGNGQRMKDVFQMIRDVAPTDATVLVTGESGTGKELVAQAIHRLSARKNRRLIILNCAALPESLLESELFGHVRGAFTGAQETKQGLVEAADKGTLFLDEIGDMPLATQVKLLRFLQEGEVRPVGSTEAKHVNVRVIAATNRDLDKEVARNRFREDLFYRLNVINVQLPALRQRREDIALLSSFFLKRFGEQYKKPALQLTAAALAILENYDWPGNIRELQHVIERAVVLSKEGEVLPLHLPEKIHAKAAVPKLAGSSPNLLTHLPYQEAKEKVLSDFTLGYVNALLQKTSGQLSKAATLAGMERSNFRRLVERFRNSPQTPGDPGDEDKGSSAETPSS